MDKKLLPVGALILLVFISGCLGGASQCPVVVDQKEGLVILDARPSYTEIPVGDLINLDVTIQNRGNSEARNIAPKLWSHPGFSINTSPYDYDSTMGAPNLDICSEGDAQILSWRLQTGCDPRESILGIAIDYDYVSSGFATIFIVSSEEAAKTGGRFDETGTNVPSAGPLQVEIEPLQQEPVILSPDANTFDARIKFRNLGDGIVGKKGEGEIRKVTVKLEGVCEFVKDITYWEDQPGYQIADPQTLIWQGLDTTEETVQGTGTSEQGTEVGLTYKRQEALRVAHIEVPSTFENNKNIWREDVNLIRDFCTVTVDADYHYEISSSTSKKVGIIGSSQQVRNCRMKERPILDAATLATIQSGLTVPVYCCKDGDSPEDVKWTANACAQDETQVAPSTCDQYVVFKCNAYCDWVFGMTGQLSGTSNTDVCECSP